MNASQFSNRWFAYLCMLIFLAAKIPHLSYPFYWDESWVYAPAIFHMHANGASISPDAIPLIFARGHPLLFHAGCAIWMNIFGPTNYAMHCYALFISAMLAVALFEVMLHLFGQRTALLSLVLLLTNITFFGESSLVLTDIMLALFTFLSLYFYITDKKLLTALTLTILFFTKESGMVAGVVIGIDILICLLKKSAPVKQLLIKSLSVAVPFGLILTFFVVQHHIFGWYFFPEHTSAIKLNLLSTFHNIQESLRTLFFSEHIYYIYLLLLIVATIVGIRLKKFTVLLLLPAAVLLYLSVWVFSYNDVVFPISILACFAMVGKAVAAHLVMLSTIQQRFLKLCVAFSICYIYFCSINFFESRYLFPALFLISIVVFAVLFDRYIATIRWYQYIVALAGLVGGAAFVSEGNEWLMYDRMNVQEELVRFFEKNNYYDRTISTTSWLQTVHLRDPYTGFRHTKQPFTNIKNKTDNSTEFVVFDNIDEHDPIEYDNVKNSAAYTLLFRYQAHTAWVEVYKKSEHQ